MANNNPLRFKVGKASDILEAKNLPQTEVIYGHDKAVFSAFGKVYYGKPTLQYKDNKLTLLGISGNSATTLGEVTIAQGGGGGDDVIPTDIIVKGANVGNVTTGTTFTSGTTVIDILKQILSKTIKPTVKSYPIVKSTGATLNYEPEVGTLIPSSSFTLYLNYTDGVFNTFTGTSKPGVYTEKTRNAGCTYKSTTWSDNDGLVPEFTGTTFSGTYDNYFDKFTLDEQTSHITAITSYSASTVIPIDNDGNQDASVNIPSSSITSDVTIKVKAGKERIFIGYSDPNGAYPISGWGTGGTALDEAIRGGTANTTGPIVTYTTLNMVKNTVYDLAGLTNLFGLSGKGISIPQGKELFIIYPSDCTLNNADTQELAYNTLSPAPFEDSKIRVKNGQITLCDGGGDSKVYKYTAMYPLGQDIDLRTIKFKK